MRRSGWHVVGRGLRAGADASRDGGRGACCCGGVRRGRVQRQRVLQLQQLMVRIQRRRRTVPALVRSTHYVAPIGEAAHIGWGVVMRVAGPHDAFVSFRTLGIYVGETTRSQPRGAVPLFTSMCQVILQAESVAAVQQQSTFAGADEAS